MAEEKYKIVVFGAFGAGKSTLIQTLDPQAKHIEAECAGGSTTIALDYGRVQIGEKRVYLYHAGAGAFRVCPGDHRERHGRCDPARGCNLPGG